VLHPELYLSLPPSLSLQKKRKKEKGVGRGASVSVVTTYGHVQAIIWMLTCKLIRGVLFVSFISCLT
jgi:hypothetical protein